MVIVGAMREARLEGALAPGAFVKLCLKHRRQFETMHADVNELADVREAAEDALEAHGVLMLTYDDDDGED
jgi:hypothetical protein